jgi:hypothetical protein
MGFWKQTAEVPGGPREFRLKVPDGISVDVLYPMEELPGATNKAASDPGGPSRQPTAAMPGATTELSQILAGDSTIQVRRPAKPDRRAKIGLMRGAADSAACAPANRSDDPRLGRIIEAWTDLPEEVRAAITTVVDGLPELEQEGAAAAPP